MQDIFQAGGTPAPWVRGRMVIKTARVPARQTVTIKEFGWRYLRLLRRRKDHKQNSAKKSQSVMSQRIHLPKSLL